MSSQTQGPSIQTLFRRGHAKVKKLRKTELMQVCRGIGLSPQGLKQTLVDRISDHLQLNYRQAGGDSAESGHAAMAVKRAVQLIDGQLVSMTRSQALHRQSMPIRVQAGGHAMVCPMHSMGSGSALMNLEFQQPQVVQNKEDDASILNRSEKDPFYAVYNLVAGPVRLSRGPQYGRQTLRASFEMSRATKVQLNNGVLTLLARCFKLGGAGKESGHIWPLESQVHFNNDVMQVRQRKVYYQGHQRTLKGECDPLDITPYASIGNNTLLIECSDLEAYALVVQLVRNVEVTEVRRSFMACRVDDGDGDGDDDDLLTSSTRLSLRCPLGLVPLEAPARGSQCTHLQCFDLTVFLSYNKKCPAARWKCCVCNKPIEPTELIVDPYLDSVIKEFRAKDLDADEVEISANGSWKVVTEDDKQKAPPRAKRKRSVPAEVNITGTATSLPVAEVRAPAPAPAAPAPAPATPAPAPAAPASVPVPAVGFPPPPPAGPAAPPVIEVVDLSLDSDEEDAGTSSRGVAAAAPSSCACCPGEGRCAGSMSFASVARSATSACLQQGKFARPRPSGQPARAAALGPASGASIFGSLGSVAECAGVASGAARALMQPFQGQAGAGAEAGTGAGTGVFDGDGDACPQDELMQALALFQSTGGGFS